MFITMNYAPEMTAVGPFTTAICQYLASCGHEVSVITTFPHYPQWAWQRPPVFPWTTEVIDGVTVRRVPVVLPRGGALWRVAYDVSLPIMASAAFWTLPRPDVVVCVSPPIEVGFAGALIRAVYHCPVVLQVEDLPLEAAISVGLIKSPMALAIGRFVERLAYGAASRTVVISRRFRPQLASMGIAPSSITELPHWAPDRDALGEVDHRSLRSELGISPNEFVLVHTGNIGEKQDLETAVDAMELVQGERPCRLVLAGDGSRRVAIERRAAPLGDRCIVLGLLPRERLDALLREADAFLLIQRRGVVDSVVPSKLLTYMSAGRPILVAAEPSSAAVGMVTEANCGVELPPADPVALARGIEQLASGADSGLRKMGSAGQRYAAAHHDRQRILERWLQLIDESAVRPRR